MLAIISALLYRMGGTDQWKWCPIKQGLWRSFIGIPIALVGCFSEQSLIPAICILTFWFQPPYGENSYLNFLGEWGKFAFCGLVFGLSSLPLWLAMNLWWVGLLQGIIGALAFFVLKVLDDKNIVKNPWVELGRGFFGTLLTIGA